MEALEHAYITRARHALSLAIGETDPAQTTKAAAFVAAAKTYLIAGRTMHVRSALENHPNRHVALVGKAAAENLADPIWQNGDAQALAQSYIASIAPWSLFDQLLKYATVVPAGVSRVMIASDAVGDAVLEGAPKPVRRVSLSVDETTLSKAIALIVLTHELARSTGAAGSRMFENELRRMVTRALNLAVLNHLTDSSTIALARSGDALADLRAGIAAAGPSEGYVVAAGPSEAADLALRVENSAGMGVLGGSFVPGVEVVAIDSMTGLAVIPASRYAAYDAGIELRSADHASVDLREDLESPAELTSLWQTDCSGLILERQWMIAGSTPIVLVGGS